MKKTVTLRIDRDLLRRTSRLAARSGVSLSQLLSDQIETLIARDRSYEAAKRSALARLEKGYDLGWARPSTRDELHER